MKIGQFALGLSLTVLAVPAAAAEPQAAREAVRYTDLDLTSEAGQSELARRIDAAARSVCRVHEKQTGSMLPVPGSRECYLHAKANAQTRVAELIAGRNPAG